MPTVLETMKQRLGKIVPEAELVIKAPMVEEILALKKEKKTLILGHNYMEPTLFHTVPDFVGDSLDLSRKAAAASQPVIIFLGVRFMAETAKILNPEKTVLLPSEKGGCSLAASLSAADVRALKQRYPGVPVVSYVNTYAEVKAESDICCTSSNAAAVVNSLKADTVIFLPDEYLARNTAKETGKRIILPRVVRNPDAAPDGDGGRRMIAWHGRCEVHEQYTVRDIDDAKRQFDDLVVLSHPECSPDVVEASDFSGSTNAMIEFVKQSNARRYLLLTECSMGDNLAAADPGKEMVRLCSIRCPHMNEITLEETLQSLKLDRYVIDVQEPILSGARRAVERMLEIGGTRG
jgi:quinolinate synthase